MRRILAMLMLAWGGLCAGAADANRAVATDGWDWLPIPPGQLVPVGELPVGMAQSADGRWTAISHGGTGRQSLWLFDVTTGKAFPVATAGRDDAFFVGVALTADGRRVFSSGGAANTINVHDVGNWWQESRLARFSFGAPGAPFFPAGMALSPDSRTLYVANLLADQVALLDVRNPSQPRLAGAVHVGSRPFTLLLDKAGQTAFVAHEGEPTIGIVDLTAKQLTATVKVGERPVALALSPDEKWLYAACAGSDDVAVVDVTARKKAAAIDLGGGSGSKGGPPPCRPQALAVSRDGKQLFVASALYHDLLVVDTARRKVAGMIPTGWCPIAVAVSPANDKLYVASARDLGSVSTENVYDRRAPRGLLQILPLPDDRELQLQSQRVCEAHDFDQRIGHRVSTVAPRELPVPRRPGQPAAIHNIVVLVQEPGSFDRMFGDVSRAATDPWLCCFGREITANQHALADAFTLCDNFYLDGPLLAGDNNLLFGGTGSALPRRHHWPSEEAAKPKRPAHTETGKASSGYGPPRVHVEPVDAGSAPWLWPTTATLWDLADRAGLSRRAYGPFAQGALYNGTSYTNWPGDIASGADIKRCDLLLHDLDRILKQGTLPRLVVASLPNNRTLGTALGAASPRALVCENDVAIGRIVSVLARSKFWDRMVILIVPGDAGSDFDHLDAHRAPMVVISPFARRGAVVSRGYDGPSVIRTIEQILGVVPSGFYDLAAVPMWDAFMPKASPRVHRIIPASYDVGEKNPPNAFGQAESGGLSMGPLKADRATALSRLLWIYLHGPDTAPPPLVEHRRTVTPP
jgi:DNA-binding beta-propeller fold protein YncE